MSPDLIKFHDSLQVLILVTFSIKLHRFAVAAKSREALFAQETDSVWVSDNASLHSFEQVLTVLGRGKQQLTVSLVAGLYYCPTHLSVQDLQALGDLLKESW
jgi:hypothetical protein